MLPGSDIIVLTVGLKLHKPDIGEGGGGGDTDDPYFFLHISSRWVKIRLPSENQYLACLEVSESLCGGGVLGVEFKYYLAL